MTPAFEPSVRETLSIPAGTRLERHESPHALIADWLRARKAGAGPVGVEETVRFFAFDGLAKLGIAVRDDAGVVRACRVVKSPAELALMQAASDITIAAYRDTAPQIARGMTPQDIGRIIGGHGGARRHARLHIDPARRAGLSRFRQAAGHCGGSR